MIMIKNIKTMSRKKPKELKFKGLLVYLAYIKKFGNSAHIPFFKKFIGKKVYIYVIDMRRVKK